MPRTLAIVERAYRGTLEEQYAHILWICWSLRKFGGEIDVLLRGNAVLYARRDQDRPELAIGEVAIPGLPDYLESVEGLLKDGSAVFAAGGDLDRLHLEPGQLHPGVHPVEASELADLFSAYDMIWYW